MTDRLSKAALRTELRAGRMALEPAAITEKSQRIVAATQAIRRRFGFRQVHCFEPITRLHEVAVQPLFSEPDITFYTSRRIAGEWQIISVTDEQLQRRPQLDAIIVPMLGFDASFHRLGYGGGYYDRLLADYPEAVKIGVCYEMGRLASLPVEPHDIAMSMVITEAKVAIAI